eukprot:4769144-Amphidinium_carterae.1
MALFARTIVAPHCNFRGLLAGAEDEADVEEPLPQNLSTWHPFCKILVFRHLQDSEGLTSRMKTCSAAQVHPCAVRDVARKGQKARQSESSWLPKQASCSPDRVWSSAHQPA